MVEHLQTGWALRLARMLDGLLGKEVEAVDNWLPSLRWTQEQVH